MQTKCLPILSDNDTMLGGSPREDCRIVRPMKTRILDAQ